MTTNPEDLKRSLEEGIRLGVNREASSEASSITGPALSPPVPEESIDYGKSLDKLRVKYLEQQLKETTDVHDWRKNYASKIFRLVAVWLGLVNLAVFLQGFKFFSFSLEREVIIAFITSTTISIVGLFLVVANWLFPNKYKSDNSKDDDKTSNK